MGAGATGCEIGKAMALLHFAEEGTYEVYDDDAIEVSNLNRQYLYSPTDVGKNKAVVLAEKMREINPRMNVNGHA